MIRKDIFELNNEMRIILVMSLLPAFFPIIGLIAISIVRENTISWPDIWLATPCAALNIVPKNEFNIIPIPYCANIEEEEFINPQPANEVISFISFLLWYLWMLYVHSE